MTLLRDAVANTDDADLMVLACVETVRDQEQPATASAVAALIGGAPEGEVLKRLSKMWRLQLLDVQVVNPARYQLTELGAELLRRELVGWSPSNREESRRQDETRSRLARALGSHQH
jgi:DNA-binding PadR family transcriptional regulator